MDRNGRTSRRRRPAVGDGFTLLEVMVALAVMALVLVSVFRINAQSVSMSETARFQSLAALMAQQTLAQTLATASEPPFSDAGSFDGDRSGYRWRIDMVSLNPLVLADERVLKMTRIDVEITQKNGPLRYALRTYR